jgi:hypothetical protein
VTNWMATPADYGFAAFMNGALECECPHPPNTPEAIMWKKGWRSAQTKSAEPPR